MSHVPTEQEVAQLWLTAGTVGVCRCEGCQQRAEHLRSVADQDAPRCRVALSRLVQRELALLCTDSYHGAMRLKERLCDAHPDAEVIDGEESQAAGLDAAATLADLYQRLRGLLERATEPSEQAQEWVELHTAGDGDPHLCRQITARDCQRGA